MKFLQVGGCVRDRLMGREVHDHDWLVVGGTPDEMIKQGFQPVGRDFPVFLHPETHEEYALARTERKHGQGHGGFVFYSSPDVRVEDDLIRRDLTINAMAVESVGEGPGAQTNLIDPYGGQHDLQAKILRHVSTAFVEDPLRVWRVARFAARFADFTIAEETAALMVQMVENGELQTLSAERVWNELHRGLQEDAPWRMLEVLDNCGALKAWLPELFALHDVPQSKPGNSEKDVWAHLMQVLKVAVKQSNSPLICYGVLCRDLGKAKTLGEDLPSHQNHAVRGSSLALALSERLRAPKAYQRFGTLCARWHDHLFLLYDHPQDLTQWWVMFNGVDLWRRPEQWKNLLLVLDSELRSWERGEDAPFTFLSKADAVAQTICRPFLGEAGEAKPTDRLSHSQIIMERIEKAVAEQF